MLRLTSNPLTYDMATLSYLSQNDTMAKSVLMDLMKSKQRTGLVQVERTMVSKNGHAFTKKIWIRPDRFQPSSHHGVPGDRILQGKENLNAYNAREFEDREKKLNQKVKEFTWADDAYDYFGLGDYDKGKSFPKWEGTLEAEELDAISEYTTYKYHAVNGYLRGTDMGHWDTHEAEEIIPYLESAIDKFELKDDIVVHRKMYADSIKLFKVGEEWQDDGFTSTTPIEGSFRPDGMEEEGSIDIVIHVKAGKGVGAWIAPLSELESENEFLLNRGTKFKVKRISSKLDGKGHRIELEVVGRVPKELDIELEKSSKPAHISKKQMDKYTWSADDLRKVKEGDE